MKPLRLALACAGVLTLAAGCGPEYSEDALSMAPAERSTVRGTADRAAASRSIPLQALLVSAKAPDCEAPKRTPEAAVIEHRPTASKSSDRRKVAAIDQKMVATDANTGSAFVSSAQAAPKAQDAAATDLEARIKLEYERACYKQAEAATRARLSRLQTAMREFVKRQQAAVP
ncbi:MAG: hypothetical protein ACKVP3_22860 [Hyphomicrobiaceae bacterium]